jgi:hypothetical protein
VPETITLRQINRATLARQMLLERERVTPLAAVERLVGLQAQWPRPPFIGLWSRIDGFERDALVKLFERRKAVRGTFLRGTIHVVSAEDFVTLRPAVQPALDGAMQSILRSRIDGLDLDRLVNGARRFLGKQPRPFEDLRDEFLRLDPEADERALGYAVRMRLPLVQVPDPTTPWGFPNKASFAPADHWLGCAIPTAPARPDALVLRYLAAYGPASAADVQAWSGLSGSSIAEAVARLRPRLVACRDERKRELLDLPRAPRPDGDTPAPVRLVPEYDNLITARADERFVAKAHRPRVFLSALRVAATVLIDGFVAATWHVKATRTGVTLILEPFRTLPKGVRAAVTEEAERLAHFIEPDARRVDVKVENP